MPGLTLVEREIRILGEGSTHEHPPMAKAHRRCSWVIFNWTLICLLILTSSLLGVFDSPIQVDALRRLLVLIHICPYSNTQLLT